MYMYIYTHVYITRLLSWVLSFALIYPVVSSFMKRTTWQGSDVFSQQSAETGGWPVAQTNLEMTAATMAP